jgi:hypothetical protein
MAPIFTAHRLTLLPKKWFLTGSPCLDVAKKKSQCSRRLSILAFPYLLEQPSQPVQLSGPNTDCSNKLGTIICPADPPPDIQTSINHPSKSSCTPRLPSVGPTMGQYVAAHVDHEPPFSLVPGPGFSSPPAITSLRTRPVVTVPVKSQRLP